MESTAIYLISLFPAPSAADRLCTTGRIEIDNVVRVQAPAAKEPFNHVSNYFTLALTRFSGCARRASRARPAPSADSSLKASASRAPWPRPPQRPEPPIRCPACRPALTCLSDRHRNGQWPWEQWYDPIDSNIVR